MDTLNYLNTSGGLVASSLFFILGIIVVQLTHHRETVREQTSLFIAAFMVRMAMIVVVYYFGFLKVLGDEDSSGWVAGLQLCNDWRQAGYNLFSLPQAIMAEVQEQRANNMYHFGYKILLGVEFFVLSMPGRISAAALNALVGSWIPVLAYRMSMQLFDNQKAARYVGWTLVFMPSLIVFSSQTIKEPVVVFIEVLCLYCCLQLAQFKFSIRHIAALILGIVMVNYMRFYVVYVILGTLFLTLTIPPIFKSKFRNVFLTLGLLFSPIVFMVTYRSALVELNQIRTEQARALKSYQTGFGESTGMRLNSNVKNPFDITKNSQIIPGFLFGLIHLMYAPFPWHLAKGSLRMLLTTPEMLWWYYNGSFRLFRGLRDARKINLIEMLIPIAFCTPLLLFYSLIFNNIGLAYRYRAQIFPELMLFISLGYYQVKVLTGINAYNLSESDLEEEHDYDYEQDPAVAPGGFYPGYRPNPGRFHPGYSRPNPSLGQPRGVWQYPNTNDRFR